MDTYSNDLCADERECGLGHNRPPAKELPFDSSNTVVLSKRPRVLPVTEADPVMTGTAAKVKNDTENNEGGNRDDFDRREYKFTFSIGAYKAVEH